MKVLLSIFVSLLISIKTLAASHSLYIAPSAVSMYGSGESTALSSLFGPSVALAGGLKFHSAAFEFEFKKINLSNESLGDEDYKTQLQSSIISIGTRLYLNRLFSIKAGLAEHFVKMNIEKNGESKPNEESDGEYFGFYGGMGIMRDFTPQLQGFLESTLYPIPEIDIYFVDSQLGIRIYL